MQQLKEAGLKRVSASLSVEGMEPDETEIAFSLDIYLFSHTHTRPLLSSSLLLFTCHSNCSFNYSVLFESLTLLSVLRLGCFSQEAPGVLNVCCLQQKLRNFGFLIFSKLRFRCIFTAVYGGTLFVWQPVVCWSVRSIYISDSLMLFVLHASAVHSQRCLRVSLYVCSVSMFVFSTALRWP